MSGLAAAIPAVVRRTATGRTGPLWRRVAVALLVLGAAIGLTRPTTVLAQTCDAPADGIRIVGAVEQPVTVTRSEMEAMPTVSAEAVAHDEATHAYEGVTLRSLLDRAGVPGGAELHGRHLSAYVAVEARDGYRVTFALAELDGGYWDTLPILAFRRDGEPLDDHAGPFQVIAPDTPKHGRWARQVACLRVGYPES